MNTNTLTCQILEFLDNLPIYDVHTHLIGGKLGATGLHDLLLYHMVISELYAAGCPSGNRLTQFPAFPDEGEATHRIQEAIPYLPYIQNTSTSWLLRKIFSDLYDWHEPITTDNWQQLDRRIRQQASQPGWAYSVLDRAKILRSGTELARRGNGEDDDRLMYSLEWAFFTRCQWGEYDTALYELERCWGRKPESPSPIGGKHRPPTERTIRSLDDVHEAVQYYVDTIPFAQVVSLATHISTDIDYKNVSAKEMELALKKRQNATIIERDIYASYVNECFLEKLEAHAGETVFQFSLGAEPLPYETASRISQRTISQLAEMIARHPTIQFQVFLSSRHANQSLCTLARELPNLALVGYWWHNFFPDIIQQVMGERLDMLPVNRQIGFFSDAYCVEWSYAKSQLVRLLLARALAQRVEYGQYDLKTAKWIAEQILVISPATLLHMRPHR